MRFLFVEFGFLLADGNLSVCEILPMPHPSLILKVNQSENLDQ